MRILGAIARGAVVLFALVAIGAGLFYAGRCTADDFNPDQPSEVLSGSSVVDAVEDEGPRSRFSPFEGEAKATARGRSKPVKPDSPERRQAERFATDALASLDSVPLPDSLELAADLPPADAPGLLPPFRVMRDGDRAAISALDSRGAWVREEQECPEGRRWEAGTTSDGAGFYGNCERAIPSLLPKIGKTIGVCAIVGGLAAGIAAVSAGDDEDPAVGPAEAGIGGAALCGGIALVSFAM